jgi:uncharacterized protein YbjT (DUF2867 family)
MKKILVIGASGTVGSSLADLLSGAGHEVHRATSRAPGRPGEVQLDLVTGEGVADAFRDVDSAFLLAPPGHVNQHELLMPLIDQAVANELQKVVLMSAMGANAVDSTPLRLAELHLEQSGLAFNIIRPNWFMKNFNTFWIKGILEQGRILLSVGTAKGSFIDARDIARVASVLLASDTWANRDFDLTGTEALDHDQVADVLSRVTGEEIRYENISDEAMRQGLLEAQLPAPYAEFLLTILGFFRQGYSERITQAVQEITGRAPTTFDQYAMDYRDSWMQ